MIATSRSVSRRARPHPEVGAHRAEHDGVARERLGDVSGAPTVGNGLPVVRRLRVEEVLVRGRMVGPGQRRRVVAVGVGAAAARPLGAERPAGAEVQAACLRVRRRPRRERRLERRDGCARRAACAVVEQDPDRGLRLVVRERRGEVGLTREAIRRERERHTRQRGVAGGRVRARGRGDARHPAGDVEVEELGPACDHVGSEGLGMRPVGDRHLQRHTGSEVVDRARASTRRSARPATRRPGTSGRRSARPASSVSHGRDVRVGSTRWRVSRRAHPGSAHEGPGWLRRWRRPPGRGASPTLGLPPARGLASD